MLSGRVPESQGATHKGRPLEQDPEGEGENMGDKKSSSPCSKASVSSRKRFTRAARLAVLQRLVRPLHHTLEGESVSFAERQADMLLARMMQKVLAARGLKGCYLRTTFGEMHYYDSHPGSSEPPVWLQHGIGSSGQCFALIADIVRKKRRVIMPDLFHFCGFSKPNNALMTLTDHLQSLRELCEGLKLKSLDYCGLSLGGWIGLKWAALADTPIRSLMLLNAAGLRFGSVVLRDALTTLSWDRFHKQFPGIMYAAPFHGVSGISPLVRRSLYRLLKDPAVRAFLRTVRPTDFVDFQLKNIAVPVRLLWGDRDSFLSPRCPHYFVDHLPKVEGYYVQDCAHILCLEAPNNVLFHIDDFFALGLDARDPERRLLKQTFPVYSERDIRSNRDQPAQPSASVASKTSVTGGAA